MNAKRLTCVALATAFAAVTNCALAQTWLASGPKIWTQSDSDDFSPAYTNGATATFTTTGAGTVNIDAGGVTPGAVVVDSTVDYTFTGGSIGGAGSLTKKGSAKLILKSSNSFSGGVFINAGTLQFEAGSTSAGLGDAGNVVTFTGNGTIYLTGIDLTFPQGIAVNGVSAVLNGNAGRDITFNNALTGSGILTLNAGGNPLNVNLNSTANTFSGNIRLIEYDCALTMNSLADSVGSQMVLGSSSKNKYANFTYGSGAIVPLVLNERQIVFGSGYGSIKISNNASGANTITINKDVINNGTVGNRTFTLGGSNTGNNTFAGAITNGASYVTSLSKADAGTWILSGNNTYSGSTTVSAGILVLRGNNTYTGSTTVSGGTLGFANGSLGSAGTINAAGGTLLWLPGNTQDISSRLPLASGTSTFNTYGNDVTFASAIGSGAAGAFTKTGLGTLTFQGTNTYTGATTVSGGGNLILDYGTAGSLQDGSKLSNTAALTLSSGNLVLKGGSHTELVSATTLGTHTGSSISRDGGSSKISLGALTVPTGSTLYTLMIGETNLATTTTVNATPGILPLGRVTVGSHFGCNDGSGNVVAYSAYDMATTAGGSSDTLIRQLTGGGTMAATLRGYALRLVNDGDSNVLELGIRNLEVVNNSSLLYAGGGNNQYTINGTGALTSASTDQPFVINTYAGTILTVNARIVGRNGNPTGIVKAGQGTLVVGGANDGNISNGICYIQQGVLRLANDTGLGQTTAGTVVHGGAALELSNNITVGAESLTITGNGVANGGALRNVTGNTSAYGGAITISGGGARINSDGVNLPLASNLVTSAFNDATIGGSGNTTVSGVISGAGNLIKVDSGTLTLSGANTYSGETMINGGKLALGAHNVLTGKSVTLNNGTLDAGAYTNTLSTLKVAGSAAIVMSPGAVLAFADSRAIAWSGTLNLTGVFAAGTSLRFGTSSAGLTSDQMASLTATGYTLSLNADGYLTGKSAGTLISFQ